MLAAPAPAAACLSSLDPPEIVLLDRPPADRPPGYFLLRVVGTRVGGSDDLVVRIVEPARARRLGTYAWLRTDLGSSCLGWGRLGSEAFTVVRVAGRLRGRILLEARIYQRSPWDAVWEWFGVTRYSAAGPL
jgi:hypothetical protein